MREIQPGQYTRVTDIRQRVTLTRGFWIGTHEVSQREYESVLGSNPSFFQGESLPVEKVSFLQAEAFCNTLTTRDREAGRIPADMIYRLPTEAEWEYAYRSGTQTTWYNGDDETRVGEIAQYRENNFQQPGKVGSRAPNAFGLHDMAGNLWEIVSDYWTPRYDRRTTVDPIGPEKGQGCVTRGGNWGGDNQQVLSLIHI